MEHFVLLLPSALGRRGRLQRGRAAAASPPAGSEESLFAAALAGRHTVLEVWPGFDAARHSLPDGLQLAAAPAQFWYPWVAIDLGGPCRSAREALLEGITLTDPGRRGLLFSAEPTAGLPVHVESIGCREGDLGSRFLLFQYVRATLLSLPRTRVLVNGLAQAVLLEDALAAHDVAIAVDEPVPAAPAAARASRSIAALRRRLQWLADSGDAPICLASSTGSASPPGDAQRMVREANLALAPREDVARDAALRAIRPIGAVQPLSAAAVAAHLCHGEGVRRPPRAEGAFGIRELDLQQRPLAAAARRVLFTCVHLLGDALNATPVLREYRRLHPEDHVTLLVADEEFTRIFELCPDVDRLAFVDIAGHHDLIFARSRDLVARLPYAMGFDVCHVLDIQEVSTDPVVHRDHLHMAEGYARRVGIQLSSCRPALDVAKAHTHRPASAPAGRYVVLSRQTVSGRLSAEHKKTKRWAETKWHRLAGRLRRELGVQPVSIGTISERRLEAAGVLDLHDLSILQVAGLLAHAAALICVDNGVFHIGMAVGTPTVHLSPTWLGEGWTRPSPDVPHREVRGLLPRVGVETVFRAAAELLATRPLAQEEHEEHDARG